MIRKTLSDLDIKDFYQPVTSEHRTCRSSYNCKINNVLFLEWFTGPKDTVARVGDTVDLHCAVKGYQMIFATWYMKEYSSSDWQMIDMRGNYKRITSHGLRIKKARKSDGRNYKCSTYVWNGKWRESGYAHKSAKLTLTGRLRPDI